MRGVLHVPRVRQTVHLGEYTYPLEFYAAGPSRVTVEDTLGECVHCGTGGGRRQAELTYCENCGSINCSSHIETERLEGDPVCTECAVTERFAFARKYFYDEQNLEAFREEYAEMGPHEKAMENPPLVVAGAVAAFVLSATGAVLIPGLVAVLFALL